MKSIGFLIMTVVMISGCTDKYNDPCLQAEYISAQKLRLEYPIVSAPREIGTAAKIYNYNNGDIILVNERNKGIHVIDNHVRETPVPLSFIDIPGNIDMAVKDGFLYIDSFTDLIVMDIRDINDIKTVYRKEEVFPYDPYQAITDLQNSDECYRYDESRTDAFVIGYR